MKQILIWIAALTAIGTPFVGWVTTSWSDAASYGIGSVLTLINLGGTTWLWGRVRQRKLLALSVLVIVFKYAILGAILYRLLKTEWLSVLWFSIGLSTLVLGTLGSALFGPSEEELASDQIK